MNEWKPNSTKIEKIVREYIWAIPEADYATPDVIVNRASSSKERLRQLLGGWVYEEEFEGDRACLDDVFDIVRAEEVAKYSREPLLFSWLESWLKDQPLEAVCSNRTESGMRLTKAIRLELAPKLRFNRILLDDAEVDRLIHWYSMIKAQLNVNGRLRLSVLPEDLLTISDNATYKSCHSIGSDHCLGNFDYVADQCTVVAYYYKNLIDDETPLKRWRVLIYVDPDNGFVVSKEYPNARSKLRSRVIEIMQERFERAGKPRPTEIARKWNRIDYIWSSTAYADKAKWQLFACDTSQLVRFAVDWSELAATQLCEWCDEPITGDSFTIGDLTVCGRCYDELFVCDRCGGVVPSGDSYSVHNNGNEEWWCEVCVEYHAHTCGVCGDIYADDADLVEVGHDLMCPDCAEEHAYACEVCGKFFPDNEKVEIEGEWVCHGCAQSQREAA